MTELLKMNCAKKTARADANNNECLKESQLIQSDYGNSGNTKFRFIYVNAKESKRQ